MNSVEGMIHCKIGEVSRDSVPLAKGLKLPYGKCVDSENESKSENSSISGENSSDHRPWQSYHTVYTNAKAGMDGMDKERVQRIVYEMSKGSKYFENEEKKEALMKEKIEYMRYAK